MEVFDTIRLSDELWEKYYDFQKELNLKYYENKKLDGSNWLEFKENKIKKIEFSQHEEYDECIILNENQVVGWYDRLVTPINILFGFDSVYEYLPEEFILTLFKEVYNFMLEKSKSEAFWWSYDERKLKQISSLNVEKFEDYIIYKLEKELANLKLFKSWIDDVEGKFKYHTEVYENSSEFELEKFSDLVYPILTELNLLNPVFENRRIKITNNDVKDMILTYEKSGFLSYYYILFNEFNEMIAVRNVIINKSDPQRIHYDGGLTGVHKNYRGNGFGRYLKAKMFFHLLKKYPNFNMITTDTMPWNKYMYKINEEFGFKPYKKGAKYRFTTKFLENYLHINN